MTAVWSDAHALFSYTQALRRDFHQHPELGFQEGRTAGIVARELRRLGLEVHTGVAETGVVALIEGAQDGPTVLARFDMDALPIQEETGAPYASQRPGVMHACGHDGHTAIGLTVARLLAARAGQWRGRVKLVFQPAEEGLGGALRMVQEGVLENPRPDYALALHLWNGWPVGRVGVTEGPAMAAAEMFRVVLTGRGGHAAIPHATVDPVVAAGHLITALHSVVSRNVSPEQAAVLTVASVHAGQAPNVIPEQAVLEGTLRAFDEAVLGTLRRRLEEVAQGVAAAFGVQARVTRHDYSPAVVNAPEVARRVREVVHRVWPASEVLTDYRTMGSEDMAWMLREVPGCYFFVGSANPEQGLDAPHHHPRFDFDEAVLPKAAALMTEAILSLLQSED